MPKHTMPVLVLLLAIAIDAVASDTAPAPTPLTPEQQKFWDETQKDPSLSSSAIEAEAKYVEAKALFQAARFVDAREAVEEAIRIYPPHQNAQKLRDDILAVLSLRDNRLQMVTTWLHSLQDVRTQEIAVRLAGLMESGDKKMAKGDYAGAELDFDRVDVGLRSFPYEFDWGDLPEKVAAKKLEARAQARQVELARQHSDREKAEEAAKERTDLEQEALKAKVDEMLRRARVAMERKDFKRAEVDAWNAYELDRRRDDARDLYLAARHKGHVQFDDTYREDRIEKIARVHEEIHRSLIPQSELLVYPEDWQRRNLRKPRELGTQKEEPWMATIKGRMQQQITFEFEDTPFEDVVAFFRQVTGVNIIVSPAVVAAGGGGTVTLKAQGMTFEDALKWVLELTKLYYAIQDNALFINNEPVSGAIVLRMYDVADLVLPVRDFPGKELAYSSGSGTKGGGGIDIFGGVQEAEGEATQPEDLEALIKDNVAKESWDAEGVGITITSGSTLMVSQTPQVHNLIDELLAHLRNQQALQVQVTIRLLDVRKNFFEEIGMEYHNNPAGILNASSPSGYRRANSTESAAGTLYDPLTRNLSTYNPGGNGVYQRGLAIEGSYNISNFIGNDQVNAIFSAVEEETDAQIVQSPSITCFNGQRAHATFMTQYAYISDYEIVSSALDPKIDVLTFGDIIDVRPVVSSDRKYITMEIRPSSVTLQGVFVELITAPRILNGQGAIFFLGNAQYPIELPNVAVRTLRSTVMLPDKGNLLIGGFNRSLRERTHTGIPFLSHIPFLGRLFSRNGTYDENRRLFFLLNAEIVNLAERESKQ